MAAGPSRLAGGIGRECVAGLGLLTIALPMATAAGIIAYAPLGPEHAARGGVAGLFCAAVGGLVVAPLRANTGVVMTSANSAASVQASGLALVTAALADRPELLPAALPLIALATGLFQALLGLAGAGRIVKFVPFPVVSGFVSGVGLLLALKFSSALFGTLSLSALRNGDRLLSPPDPVTAALTAGLLAFTFAARHRLPRGLPVALVTFLVGILAYWGLRAAGLGGTLGGTLDAGAVWTIARGALAAGHWGADLAALTGEPDALVAILLAAGTVALVSMLETVFATRAAQTVAEFPSAPRRDLIALGIGTGATAAFGAVAFSGSASQTMVNYQEGGRSRISPLVTSVALLVLLLAVPGALALVPLCVFPPLIIFAGWRLIDPYTAAILRGAATRVGGPARAQARRDALVHLSVLLPTALNSALTGVAIGVVLSCAIFILSMSRPVVRRLRDGRAVSSMRVRTRAESEALAAQGEATVVMDLEGTLFFANAEDLAGAIRERRGARFVILDLRGVTDIDATGARILEQTRRSLAAAGIALIAAETPAAIAPTVRRLFPPDHDFHHLDDALEHAEHALLGAAAPTVPGEGVPLAAFELFEGVAPDGLARLGALLREERHPAGTVLCREGEPADRIWLIRSGSISVRVPSGRTNRRIAAFGPGTTVGEMAVVEDKPRSASLVADESLDLYVLDLDAYRHILAHEPELAAALFRNLARALSDRLRARSVALRAALD
ncbi:hypothetical protein AwMethylo_05280 [Methylobacterium sp.]|nr:hypothetical protein AwMethylo_05280 [Methylobacterium sp.]